MRTNARILAATLSSCVLTGAMIPTTSSLSPSQQDGEAKAPLVQLAILLDTSGSMEGLVDQARCQFWEVIDELSRAGRGGERTRVEVAVLEYGNQRVASEDGFVRTVVGFTEDLDLVSRALFALDLDGGDEFCATAINTASNVLLWDESDDTYRTILIAGNESFDQGSIPFGGVLPKLQAQDITLNTIYCRWKKAKRGEADRWQSAASDSIGRFLEIDHNLRLPDVATPYDAQFRELNDRMNETFVWYGDQADEARRNQIAQDENAARMSNRAFAGRMAAKVGHLYHHVHSDLVDALQHDHHDLDTMPVELMPPFLQGMSNEERRAFMDERIGARERVRREMADLVTRRHRYLREQANSDEQAPSWGSGFVAAIREQASAKGFAFEASRAVGE
ncbi:MAG: VWA domain-containing protein [Planctomycetota bacterium]